MLEEILSKDYRMLVLVLHAGESFIGFTPDAQVFDTEELIRSSVKEKHSKGALVSAASNAFGKKISHTTWTKSSKS
ncbi:hypothetical protein [Methanosarcina barkeri]|uniref:hypothetical protein n=1 Tax=Methanosarcina barkeri TaxID=2208 RepID=UPI000A6F26BE|nr:hypothetical protein [Methanosarcina barkeri]